MCWRCVPCLLLSEPFCWARSDYDQSGDNKKSLTPVSAACRCFCLRSKPIAPIRRSDEPAMMARVAPHTVSTTIMAAGARTFCQPVLRARFSLAVAQIHAEIMAARDRTAAGCWRCARVVAAPLSRTTRAIAYRHARLFQRGLHARECRVERRAKIRYRYNYRNGNTGSNETVFDGGCSALVSQELLKRDAHHGYPCLPLPPCRHTVPSHPAPSLNGSLQINIPALAHSANLRKLSASCGARPPSNL